MEKSYMVKRFPYDVVTASYNPIFNAVAEKTRRRFQLYHEAYAYLSYLTEKGIAAYIYIPVPVEYDLAGATRIVENNLYSQEYQKVID